MVKHCALTHMTLNKLKILKRKEQILLKPTVTLDYRKRKIAYITS